MKKLNLFLIAYLTMFPIKRIDFNYLRCYNEHKVLLENVRIFNSIEMKVRIFLIINKYRRIY